MKTDTPKHIEVHHPDGSYDTLPYPTRDQYGHVEVAYDTNSSHACKRYKLAWAENDEYDEWDADWAWPTFLNYVPCDTRNRRAVWDKENCDKPEWEYEDFSPEELTPEYLVEKVADEVVDIMGERMGLDWQLRVDPTGGALVWDFENDDVDVLPKERLGDIVDLGSKTRGYRLIAMCDDLVKEFGERYGDASEDEFADWKARDEAARAVLENVLDAAHDGKGLNWLCDMVNDFKANRPYGPFASLPEWAYRVGSCSAWYYDPSQVDKMFAGKTDEEKAAMLEKDIAYAYHLLKGDSMEQICSIEICGHDPDADTTDDEPDRMRYFASFAERDKEVVKCALTPPYHAKSDEFVPALVPFWNGRGEKPEGMYWVEVKDEQALDAWKYVDAEKEVLQEGDVINGLLHVSDVRTLKSDGETFVQYTTELGRVSCDTLLATVGAYMHVRRCVDPEAVVINGHVFMPRDFHCDLSKCEKEDLVGANLFDMVVTRKEIQETLDLLRRVFDTEEEAAAYLGIPVEDVADDVDAWVLGSTGRVAVFR